MLSFYKLGSNVRLFDSNVFDSFHYHCISHRYVLSAFGMVANEVCVIQRVILNVIVKHIIILITLLILILHFFIISNFVNPVSSFCTLYLLSLSVFNISPL